MPRVGVSFDEVAAVADSMRAENLNPTILGVRERLRTGSSNTIQRHLAAWRDALPQLTVAAIELPASIITAFCQEIGRARSEAKAELESRLVIVQAESAELAASGEKLEAERDELLEEFKVITTDRDMLRGTLQEQAVEIEKLSRENERERHSADQAKIEVAQLRNKLELLDEKLTSHSATIAELKTVNGSESQGKISAEKGAAVLAARLEAEQQKSGTLLSEKNELTVQIDSVRQSAESARLETANKTNQLDIQAAVLVQKAAEIQELSNSCETEKCGRIDAESNIAALQEQLTAESQAAELERNEKTKIIAEFDSQITELAQNFSESKKLTESLEAERSGRIAAELKIEVLTKQLEVQDKTVIPIPKSTPSE